MITFEHFKLEEGTPIYQQILLYIKRGIIAGSIGSGDELPSRRMMSALWGINPNTVQKAYRMLEEEGLITSHSGAKSYVDVTEEKIKQIRKELLQNDAKNIVNTMKQMGLTREEALRLIAENWEEKQI